MVSIIMPVFNAKKYLNRSIDSVLRQTYQDFEIILVDDGSTDESADICDEYADNDSRIRVLHVDNAGAAEARNIGIHISAGEYILFVDADDELEDNMLEKLYYTLVDNNADISICNSTRVYEEGFVDRYNKTDNVDKSGNIEFDGSIISGDSKKMLEMMFCDEIFRWEPWGKLYKKILFSNHRFISGRIYEDLYLIPRVFCEANKLTYINLPLYRYTIRNGSVMSYDNGLIVPCDLISITNENIKYFSDNNPKGLYELMSSFLYEFMYSSLCSIILYGEENNNKQFIKEYRTFMKAHDKDISDNKLLSKKKPIKLSYRNYALFILLRKLLKAMGKYKL